MELKPQDIVVAIDLAVNELPHDAEHFFASPMSRRDISARLGISLGEISNCYRRLYKLGLIGPELGYTATIFKTSKRALYEFLSYGIQYYSQPDVVGVGRGMPTGWSAPPMKGRTMMVPPETPLVWADSSGSERGEQITPIHKSAVNLANVNERAYTILAAIDVMRVGKPRDREEARTVLSEIFTY